MQDSHKNFPMSIKYCPFCGRDITLSKLTMTNFGSGIEPCCCGLDHINEGHLIKPWPHHKRSLPYGYCEGCQCEQCERAVEAKYGSKT